jgi:hypothetical protein
VDIPCGHCRTPAPRLSLHRVGNRLLCPICFSGRAHPGGTDASGAEDPRSLLRRSLASLGAGLALRAVLFVPLFLWARASDTGAAALKGAVGGDLFGWAVLTVFLRPFRRARFGLGALVELVLVGLYLQRETLFEISASGDATAISMLLFFLVFFAKTGIWAADHILEITGVKETA